jgi:hypothetical protein
MQSNHGMSSHNGSKFVNDVPEVHFVVTWKNSFFTGEEEREQSYFAFFFFFCAFFRLFMSRPISIPASRDRRPVISSSSQNSSDGPSLKDTRTQPITPPPFGPPSEALPAVPGDSHRFPLSASLPSSKPALMSSSQSARKCSNLRPPSIHSVVGSPAGTGTHFIASQLQRFSQQSNSSAPSRFAAAATTTNSMRSVTSSSRKRHSGHDEDFVNVAAERILDLMSRTELLHLVQSLILPATPLASMSSGGGDYLDARDGTSHFVDAIRHYAERVLETAPTSSRAPCADNVDESFLAQEPPPAPSIDGAWFQENSNDDTAEEERQVEKPSEIEELIRKANELRMDLTGTLAQRAPEEEAGETNFQEVALGQLISATEAEPKSISLITQRRRSLMVPPPATPLPSPPKSPSQSKRSSISQVRSNRGKTLNHRQLIMLADLLSNLELYLVDHAQFPFAARYLPSMYRQRFPEIKLEKLQSPSLLLSFAGGSTNGTELGGLSEFDRELMNFTMPVVVMSTAGYDENERELLFSIKCRRTGTESVCSLRDLCVVDCNDWTLKCVRNVADRISEL